MPNFSSRSFGDGMAAVPFERRARPRVSSLGTGDHVRNTLRRAPAAILVSVALRAELRASVTAYVRRLRADGEPPQRMLVLVKETLADAFPSELDPTERRVLQADVIRWSIDAYYQAV
jgi:hypothetical protein